MTDSLPQEVLSINSLEKLNQASAQNAKAWFLQMCSSENWCKRMEESRPFLHQEDLFRLAQENWQHMQKGDLIEAFSGHPMIGALSTLRAKYAHTKSLASNEQSGTQVASEETLTHLHAGNKAYLEKHGFIFIIFATGLSAQTMLNELNNRLPNNTELELKNAAEEQIKITLNRMAKAFK